MTALAGLWRLDGRPDAKQQCARSLSAQQIYGNDATNIWSSGDVALGRALMRILPEDVFDRQPLVGANGRFIVIADLRIDNRDELIRKLEIATDQARSMCDTAILLVAIEKWEELCFEHLVGDYACVIWDCSRQILFLARDPLGQRPLHYHRGAQFFAFSSMPKGLHALAEVPYAADEDRIAEHLALLPLAGTKTYFRDVERVEPGHVVQVSRCGLTARRHWQPICRPISLRSSSDYSDALRELLDEAVRCRLRGADRVAAHLSGGLDSSAVAATAARLLAAKGGKVTAFTAVPREGYDGFVPRNRIVDEGPYAALTAKLYSNMEHVLIRCPERGPADDLDLTFQLCELPATNVANNGWVYAVGDAARQRGLRVLLTGNMGNMGLSYDGLAYLVELWGNGSWVRWLREASALVAQGRMRWRGVLAATWGPWVPAPLWIWMSRLVAATVADTSAYSAINPERRKEINFDARAKAAGLDALRPARNGVAERMEILRECDFGNYNKGMLAGWGIDLRDPTADRRLIEFCLQVPMNEFLGGGVPKSLARRTLADRLPKTVVDEQRRGLQAADWHETLTATRRRVVAELDHLDECPAAVKALDLRRLRHLVENWPTDGWERDKIAIPYREVLLKGISFGHFLRRVHGSNN